MSEVLEINGTMGEGGGSILRLAAGFSVLFNRAIKIKNIRANRSPPGLRLQHLLGLQVLRDLTDGNLSEAEIGTTKLQFSPGNDFKEELEVNIRTAGSIALLSQTIQTAAIKNPMGNPLIINIKGGGTFGTGAPDPYYLNNVTYQYFQKMGYSCKIEVLKNGYYPKGGAAARLLINPVKDPKTDLTPLNLTHTGNLKNIGGKIIVSENLRRPQVAERIRDGIINGLCSQKIEIPDLLGNNLREITPSKDQIHISEIYEHTLNPGAGLCIWAEFDTGVILGSGTILGKRGVSSEKVAEIAVQSLIKQIKTGATVDEHLADQIIPLMYLCGKRSSIIVPEITSHMQTNIDLLEMFRHREYSIEKIGSAYKFEYI